MPLTICVTTAPAAAHSPTVVVVMLRKHQQIGWSRQQQTPKNENILDRHLEVLVWKQLNWTEYSSACTRTPNRILTGERESCEIERDRQRRREREKESQSSLCAHTHSVTRSHILSLHCTMGRFYF